MFNNIIGTVDKFGKDVTARIEMINTPTVENTAYTINLYFYLMLTIWLAGFICFAAYLIVAHLKFRRIYAQAIPVDNYFIRSRRVHYSGSMKRKVKINQSEMINSPLTYGIFRPVILLPKTIDYNDEATLEYILLHEYTHIRRFDVLSKMLLAAALCVHWFNPFVWLMYIPANSDIELSCDETVVRKASINKNVNYALALLSLEEKKSSFAADVSFSRNIMKERIKSIMKIPKKSKLRIIAAGILITMIIAMFAALQSCESLIDDADDAVLEDFEEGPFEMQEQTDKLIVYVTTFHDYFLNAAINIFKREYPDVEVEIVHFNIDNFDDRDEYRLKLSADLAVGKGPDLLVSSPGQFPDIYKAMAARTFVNLNHFIENDDEFNIGDYNKTVLDSGVYRGIRFIMPYQYEVPVLITTQEILDAEGIDFADLSTFDGFVKSAGKYGENPDKSIFYNYNRNPPHNRYFFPYSGIDLIDYSRNKVGITDKAKFKSIIDMLKTMYVRPEDSVDYNFGGVDFENLIDNKQLFATYGTIGLLSFNLTNMLVNSSGYTTMSYNGITTPLEERESATPLMLTYPNINDGMTANVRDFAAIPSASQNQVNAWNLMKILLSEDIQARRTTIFYNPVLKSAVVQKINADQSLLGNRHEQEEIEEYANLIINVDSCRMVTYAPYEVFLWEEMTPYFEGSRSFDDCYDRLVSKLELYISE